MAYIVLGTVAYGLMPVLAKVAYASGLGPLGLLASRFLLAFALFALTARARPRLPWRRRAVLLGLGGIFFGNALCYFKALETSPASVVAVLLYTHPVVVALLSAALGVDRLTARDLAASALAVLGAALTAGGLGPGGLRTTGVVFAMAAAVVYSAYIVLAGRFAAGTPSEVVARHVAGACALLFPALAATRGERILPGSLAAWAAVAGIAVVCTVVALRAFLAGLARVGPARAAVGGALEVVVTIALSVLLLGEQIAPLQAVGAVLILAAVAFQNLGRGQPYAGRDAAPPAG